MVALVQDKSAQISKKNVSPVVISRSEGKSERRVSPEKDVY